MNHWVHVFFEAKSIETISNRNVLSQLTNPKWAEGIGNPSHNLSCSSFLAHPTPGPTISRNVSQTIKLPKPTATSPVIASRAHFTPPLASTPAFVGLELAPLEVEEPVLELEPAFPRVPP